MVFMSRYFWRDRRQVKDRDMSKYGYQNLTLQSLQNTHSYKLESVPSPVCHRDVSQHLQHHLPGTSTACSVPSDKCLLASESHLSSTERQGWTRGPLQSIMIYSVLESSPQNYLDAPLVAVLCLGALILYDITLPKTPQGSELWFFSIPFPKCQENRFRCMLRVVRGEQLVKAYCLLMDLLNTIHAEWPRARGWFSLRGTSGNVWRYFCHILGGKGITLLTSCG